MIGGVTSLWASVRESVLSLALISQIALGLWALAMVSVPVIRWVIGHGSERAGISLGVVAQALLVVVLLAQELPAGAVLTVALGIPLAGWLVEFGGSRSGVPFGSYHYTEALRPQLGSVPLLIPLAWLMMLPPAWAVAGQVVGAQAHPLLFVLTAGLVFTAWDLFLDPLLVSWGFWRWKRAGFYFGIPLVNFGGWFVSAAAMTALSSIAVPSIQDLTSPVFIVIYGVTALLQFLGQLFFWKLPGPAVCGGLAMGLSLLAALL
jgi:putative membrane protein